MSASENHGDESTRLQALHNYQVLDTPADSALDELTQLAADLFDAPIALVSLVDQKRQWFKSRIGFDLTETPRAISFCTHALEAPDLFIVPDAKSDPRFADNPLVLADPPVRFYAGAPLRTPQGHVLGTLCILDHRPRKLTPIQGQTLRVLSRQVIAQLELRNRERQLAEHERLLTGIYNASPEAMQLVGLDDRITLINPAGLDLFAARQLEQLATHPMTDLVAVEDRPIWVSLRDRILQGESGGAELRIQDLAGNVKWIRINATPLRDEAETVSTALVIAHDITEQQRTQAAQAASEARYRSLFNYIPDGVLSVDADGTFLDANPALCSMLGYAAEELTGMRPADILVADQHERIAPTIQAIQSGQAGKDRWTLLRKDGTTFVAEAIPALMPDGKRLGVIRDITAAEQAESALRESEEKFHALVDHSIQGVMLVVEDQIVYVNPAQSAITGFTADELTRESMRDQFERIHPDDLPAVMERHHRFLRGDSIDEVNELRLRHKNGSWRWVRAAVRSFSLNGKPARLGMLIDITERKQAEDRIRRLNRTYAVLSEINQLIVRERDPIRLLKSACVIACQRGGFLLSWVGLIDPATKRLGIAAEEGGDETTLAILDALCEASNAGCRFTAHALRTGEHGVCNNIATEARDEPWAEAALERDFRSLVSLPITVEGRRAGVMNLYANAEDFFDEEELRLLDELAVDIAFALEFSQRQQAQTAAEAERRETEQRFRQLVDNIDLVFWMVTPERDQILYISPAFERIWGRPTSDMLDGPGPAAWLECVHPYDRQRVADTALNQETERPYDHEYRIVRPDGSVRWIHDHSFPVRDPLGRVERFVGIAEDITERRLLEEQFRESQKMEAFGQLAGGIAHDFNNILAAIIMQTELTATDETLSEDVQASLGDIMSSAQRAATLTRQLLTFSRRQVIQPRLLDLNQAVQSLTMMLQRLLREDIELHLNLNREALQVRVDAGMLDQVLLNLVVNARDAMPNGGRISISTYRYMLEAAQLTRFPDALPGVYACLCLTDTGHGISDEVLPHIFEPFFTTKESGQGTGLGLATVFGIIKQHQGAITIESAPNCGSTFRVLLPLLTGKEEPEIALPKEGLTLGGTERILVVEDDPKVRLLTRTVLERQGYQVLDADSGHQAIEVLQSMDTSVDLLITDLVMPGGMNGYELAERLQEKQPDLRVIHTSGYSDELAGREVTTDVNRAFLQKPSSPQELLRLVRRILDRPR